MQQNVVGAEATARPMGKPPPRAQLPRLSSGPFLKPNDCATRTPEHDIGLARGAFPGMLHEESSHGKPSDGGRAEYEHAPPFGGPHVQSEHARPSVT